MNRLAPLDRALVLVLVPLWVVCFALAVKTQVRGQGLSFLGMSLEHPDAYPVLSGKFTSLYPWDPLERAGLQAGDRLLRMGEADLRGVDTLGFAGRVMEEGGTGRDLSLVFERDGRRRETTLVLVPVSVYLATLAVSFAFAASALFLLLRGRPTPSVRAYFYFAMAMALSSCWMAGSRLEVYLWTTLFLLTSAITLPLLFRFVHLFPDDREPEGRWHRLWPWLFAPPGALFAVLGATSDWLQVGESGQFLTAAVGFAALLVVGTRKFRGADSLSRRQMKWVLLGFYCAFVPVAGAFAVAAVQPRLGWLAVASLWAVPLLPLSLLVSVVRFNLFDVDRVLSAAASYNVLLVLLVGGGLVVVPRAAEAVSSFLGIDPGTGQVALSLALAGVVIPAHRRLRPQIDRIFFKERYALDHGIAELLPTLSGCANARELTERVGEGLNRLLRPEACVVYGAVEESYAPVFVAGRAVPPAFGAASPLVRTLSERRRPLALGDVGRQPDEPPLDPFDRAALETLRAEVVVPVPRDDTLAAFFCLGPKRSGDVYTSTDLSQLASVAQTVCLQLQRFDQEELIREGREMQESLRRYVPGAIVDELSSGGELASGEQEVSVLFVDIRGYTSFSESRRADEIFSTVSRYTETVSEIVRTHGGAVVEFNGDGMMAVFGAPRELAQKECAALEAGREIVEAVGSMPVGKDEGGSTLLSVGVGIATGEAFVGNIQAADRMIWSAIGNTTNLAARLQGLTRDLEVSVVVDGLTWERARSAAAGFEPRSEVPIRGRRETQDLYVLPLAGKS